MIQRMALTCLIALASIHSALAAENLDKLAIADRYIEAYQVFDIDTMASYYRKDSRFIDLTSKVFGADNAYIMKNKDAIIKKLQGFVAQSGPIRLDFDIKHRYEAAGQVVYTANVKISTGSGKQLRTACAPITTIIHVEDGKVLEHRDYFDYHHYLSTLSPEDQQCPSLYGRG